MTTTRLEREASRQGEALKQPTLPNRLRGRLRWDRTQSAMLQRERTEL